MSGYRVTPHRTAGQGRRPASPRGVTLIEAVLFISVALGLIVGGIVFFQQTSIGSQVQRQARILSNLIQETRALYKVSGWEPVFAWQGGYLELDDVLVASGAVPPEIVRQPAPGDGALTPVLVNVWDGVLTPSAHYEDGQYFLSIGLSPIPVEACARLLPYDATGRSLFATSHTHAYLSRPGGGYSVTHEEAEITPAEASQFCAEAAGSGHEVNVTFYLRFYG